MLYSIYHYNIRITLKSHFCRKHVINLPLCEQRCYGRHNCKPLVVYRFECMALFHSQTRATSYDNLHSTSLNNWTGPYPFKGLSCGIFSLFFKLRNNL